MKRFTWFKRVKQEDPNPIGFLIRKWWHSVLGRFRHKYTGDFKWPPYKKAYVPLRIMEEMGYWVPNKDSPHSIIPYGLLEKGYLRGKEVYRDRLWKWYKKFDVHQIYIDDYSKYMVLGKALILNSPEKVFIWKSVPDEFKSLSRGKEYPNRNTTEFKDWLRKNKVVSHWLLPLLPFETFTGNPDNPSPYVCDRDLVLCIGDKFEDVELKRQTKWVNEFTSLSDKIETDPEFRNIEKIWESRPDSLKNVGVDQKLADTMPHFPRMIREGEEKWYDQDCEEIDHICEEMFNKIDQEIEKGR